MVTAILELPGVFMPAEEPSTGTVRIDSELIRMARIVCAHTPAGGGKNLKLVAYLDSLLREPITRQYRQVISSIAAEEQNRSRGK